MLYKMKQILFPRSLAFAAVLTLSGTASADLVLYYDLDEKAGNADAADISGMSPALDGALKGGATRTGDTPEGHTPHALDLSGGNKWLEAGDATRLDAPSQLTISLWVNYQREPGSGQRLVSKMQREEGSWKGYEFRTAGAGNSVMFTVDAVGNGPVQGGVFSEDEWVFVAVTFDAATGEVLFYDGGEDAAVSEILRETTAYDAPTENEASLLVGGLFLEDGWTASNDRSPDAILDDVRVYDSVLNASELEQVRLANVPEPTTWALLAGGGFLLCGRRRYQLYSAA